MKSTLFSRVTTFFVAFLFVFSALSCVQEEYEISEENLDLEVTVFQDGVALPLGSTEAIKVSELLKDLDPEITEMFKPGPDGTYAYGMSDEFDFSEELSFLSENFSINGFSTNEKIPFNLSGVNAGDVTVPEIEVKYEQKLSEVISPVELEFETVVPEPVTYNPDISRYLPSDKDLQLSLKDYAYEGTVAKINHVNIPLTNAALAPYVDQELPLDQVTSLLHGVGLNKFSVSTVENFEVNKSVEIPVKFTLPKMITDVDAVQFDENSKIKVTIDLSDNMFFTSGKIVPHMDLDLGSIFNLAGTQNGNRIVDDFVLENVGANPYSASGTYSVKSLALGADDVKKDGNGYVYVEKSVTVTPSLKLKFENLMTSLKHLSTYDGGDVKMSLKIEFVDFKINNVAVAVEPVTTEISVDYEIGFSELLPDIVDGVNEVMFSDESGLDLAINVANVNRVEGLDLEIKNIDLSFPKGMKVQGADASNKLSVHVGALADGKTTKRIVLAGIEFDPALQQPGKVAFDGDIKINAVAEVSVKDGKFINTKDLPRVASDNIVLDVQPSVIFDIADFEVDFNGYYQDVTQTETIEFEVSEEVAELGKVVIVPETKDGKEPVITIDMVLPDTQLPIGPSEKGLVIDLPDMIFFKELSDDIKPYYSNGKLTFTDKIPAHIELPVDYIEAEAVKKQKDGKEVYVVSDVFSVAGEVGVAPGVVVKADVDALTAPDAVIAFNAYVPEMVPSTINVDMYEVEIPENTIAFGESISLSSLPEQLVEVGEILLKDVALDIDVEAPGISGLIKDADVTLNLDVTLPEVIMLENPVQDGVLKVTGKLAGDKIEVDPVKVKGLKLNKAADELSDYLKGVKVSYGGAVTIKGATVDMDGLEDLELDVNINLQTAGTDNKIEISKVTGKIDYEIEPIDMDIDLSSLTGALEEENLKATLDLNRFSLALDLKTNLSIPLVADLTIVPYKDEAPIEGKTLSSGPIEISIPEAASEPSLVRLWISNYAKGQDPHMPAGYEHISLDIISLISLSPDALKISMTAGTDPESECSIAPSAEGYVLEAAYAFSLPFEFGEKMSFEFSQTIDDLPEQLGTILQYGSLALGGEIESSLPIELELTYNFLDSKGNRIDLVENAGKQIIKAGTVSGDPVKTDLNLVLGIRKGADISDIDAIELVFKAKSVAGAPIKEDSFIKATLQALIPEGVTLDLKDLMSNEEGE